MSLTGNYEAAFELKEQVAWDIFYEAWRSGEIPHELSETTTIGTYSLEAIVKILQTNTVADLDVTFSTPVANCLKMTLPLDCEVTVQNSPAPSINPITFSAGLAITAPVQGLPDTAGNKELVLNLAGLPQSQVQVTMPAAAVVPVTSALIEDGIHKAYDTGQIPHSKAYGGITVDILDDDADTSHQIHFTVVTAPVEGTPGSGTMTLPLLIHVAGGLDEAVTVNNIKLTISGDELTIGFGSVTAADITTSALLSGYKTLIASMVAGFGNYKVFVPSNKTIADFIAAKARQRCSTWGADANGRIHLYTPNAVENSPIEIVDFDVAVKPGFLAVLFNPMDGADPDTVENFIPDDKKFAQALAEPVIQGMIDQAIKEKILDENGCGGFPCKFDHEIEGHEVTLTGRPDFTLEDGYMHMTGSAEVAIDCWWDPDFDFEAKVNFHFETDADGNKTVVPDTYDEDVDLSCLDWFIGLIIIIVGWVMLAVINSIVDELGGKIVADEFDRITESSTYLAGEIHGVGNVTTELDRIDVKPGGIILSGGTFIASASQALTYVPSDSGSPYSGTATAPITLQAVYTQPKAKHNWTLGDGAAAQGATIQHQYDEDGIYLVKMKSHVNEPHGIDTHHFARVRVTNVQPVVDAGADIVAKEGDVISFAGKFHDAEWVDKHVARWSWGDDSMDVGAVTETNNPPGAEGVVTGKHAFCDNGEYTVVLRVIDDDGGMGRDTLKVKVENVPPKVEAGGVLFAYRCTPVNLIGRFIDPGWCDKHTGYWDFGDCTPGQPATIKELNDPPAGVGIAVATHVYAQCGNFLARCTVIDDDGGVGTDTVVVKVVEVQNRDFESGFRNLRCGAVANEWEPYESGAPAGMTAAGGAVVAAEYSAEEFVVRAGQRSQHIAGRGAFRAGIRQRVGANLNWDYQVVAWYHLDESGGGTCRLGVDPAGGTDPSVATVQWYEGKNHHDWSPLMVRVTATGRAVTVFLEAAGDAAGASAYFDEIALTPYPCPLPDLEKPKPDPQEPEEVCVNWREEKEAHTVPAVYEQDGFAFKSGDEKPMQVVLFGPPPDQGKLLLPQRGVLVTPPFIAERAVAHVVPASKKPVTMVALDGGGEELGRAETAAGETSLGVCRRTGLS